MLPYVVDIYEKLDLKTYVKNNLIKAKKGKTEELQLQAGIDLFLFVLKNTPKIKNEVFEIVALAQDKEVDEIRQQPLFNTISTFKGIFENKELVDFFKSAMQ